MKSRKAAAGKFRQLTRLVLWLAGIFVFVSAALMLTLRWLPPPTAGIVLQRQLQAASGSHALDWKPWNEIAPHMAVAVIASEDQRFLQHWGFDLTQVQKAIEERRRGGRLRGASTITQQTAKNLFLWGGRSYLRKGLEAWFTALMELMWPKHRTLEVYLNIVEFGPGVYGVGAASRQYFGKEPAELSRAEAALLAAVLPNPHVMRVDAPSEYVRERQTWILGQMTQLGGPALLKKQ